MLCEATDRLAFENVALSGTERPSVNEGQESLGLYYHFGRSVSPPTCTAVYWHMIAEYGPAAVQNVGTEYTRQAAKAVWLA